MPKQIVVANKSRAQKVKVHFRQSSFLGRAKPAQIPRLTTWAFMPAKIEFHRECEVYDLPGGTIKSHLQLCF